MKKLMNKATPLLIFSSLLVPMGVFGSHTVTDGFSPHPEDSSVIATAPSEHARQPRGEEYLNRGLARIVGLNFSKLTDEHMLVLADIFGMTLGQVANETFWEPLKAGIFDKSDKTRFESASAGVSKFDSKTWQEKVVPLQKAATEARTRDEILTAYKSLVTHMRMHKLLESKFNQNFNMQAFPVQWFFAMQILKLIFDSTCCPTLNKEGIFNTLKQMDVIRVESGLADFQRAYFENPWQFIPEGEIRKKLVIACGHFPVSLCVDHPLRYFMDKAPCGECKADHGDAVTVDPDIATNPDLLMGGESPVVLSGIPKASLTEFRDEIAVVDVETVKPYLAIGGKIFGQNGSVIFTKSE